MENLKFNDLGISDNIKRAIKDMNYEVATPIQSKSIPIILEGKDTIGLAQTGTGKTACFTIPIIDKINTNVNNVQALIMCPTRELALQVSEEVRKFAKYTLGIKTVAVYGGTSIENQIRELKRGAKIVVGTPRKNNGPYKEKNP